MGTPTLKLVFDRRKRASATKEGTIELRITYNRIQRHITTGVRVLPKHWRNGQIVHSLDAPQLQRTLDMFVLHARQVLNDLTERGELDMNTIVSIIGGRQKSLSAANLPKNKLLSEFFHERSVVRCYGRSKDSRERYDRFQRWFARWGGMITIADITEENIIRMDEALGTKMKPYSKWNNYHRFLNSFIIDAIDSGLLTRNPYKNIHINKDKTSRSLNKYLTREEFQRIEHLQLPTPYLTRARDLFVFQTYTCLSYTDLAAFDPAKIMELNGRKVYKGQRGKTGHDYVFLLLQPALDILNRYSGRLPIISNVKYNQFLKLIALAAGIVKPISSHWARHTGATLLLNSGMNMEIVSKILGHSSTTITRQVYAKLLDTTVEKAMEQYERQLNI